MEWYDWNVEKGEHFQCGLRDGKLPLCSGYVFEDVISVSSREKVEDLYAVVSLIFLSWVCSL